MPSIQPGNSKKSPPLLILGGHRTRTATITCYIYRSDRSTPCCIETPELTFLFALVFYCRIVPIGTSEGETLCVKPKYKRRSSNNRHREGGLNRMEMTVAKILYGSTFGRYDTYM